MIRRAEIGDLAPVMELYEGARIFMRTSGNPHQWINGYPSEQLIFEDIRNRHFFVEEDNGEIVGCFTFIIGEEPTYQTIKGRWPDCESYGTIHRLASNGVNKRFTDRVVEFCLNRISRLRADTHQANITMQKALTRNGFKYCGIIHVANGSERLAYQLTPFQLQ